MQRITITIEEELLAEIDKLAEQRNYQNRSKAIRDLARAGLPTLTDDTQADNHCVGALFYLYDHHDLSLASWHVHLDHGNCMEVSLLKGHVSEVKTFAEGVIAERGVRHGKLMIVPVEETHHHEHCEE